jgi:hypothetical protein
MKAFSKNLFRHPEKSIFGQQTEAVSTFDDNSVTWAGPENTGAGGKNKSGTGRTEEDENKRGTPHEKPAENSPAGKAGNSNESHGSITDADSPLTGDNGNSDIGQTDLGASGTGAEDL